MRSGAALAVFEAFDDLIEANYSCLEGVFVNLSAKEDVVFKLTLENLTDGLSCEQTKNLSDAGVAVDLKCEDGVSYVSFTMSKGGGAV